MTKELKMGWDDSADTFSFGLIAMAEIGMMLQKEYEPPKDFERFYERYGVINKGIERASKKLDMTLDRERHTQMITLLYNFLEKHWTATIQRNGGKKDAD